MTFVLPIPSTPAAIESASLHTPPGGIERDTTSAPRYCSIFITTLRTRFPGEADESATPHMVYWSPPLGSVSPSRTTGPDESGVPDHRNHCTAEPIDPNDTMPDDDFAIVSPADALATESGVRHATITRLLGCTDTTVDVYRLPAGESVSPTDYVPPSTDRESLLVSLDAPVEVTTVETDSVPKRALARLPAGANWTLGASAETTCIVVGAPADASPNATPTVLTLDDLEFAVPPTSDVSIARLTDRLGCEGTKTNVRLLRPGQAVPYHTEGSQEELFVPLDGPGTVRVAGGSHRVARGDVVRVAPPVPRGAVNGSDEDRRWLMVGAPPTGDADEWDPGAEILSWPDGE